MEEYNIYGILYKDFLGRKVGAAVSAESDKEAIRILEKAVVDGKGYKRMKGNLDAETMDTRFKTSKKGLVFGYDFLTDSLL